MLKEGTSALLKADKRKVLVATAALVMLVAWSDWAVGNTFSLGVLYILPMMLGALALSPAGIAGLAILCACLRFLFDVPGGRLEVILRFVFSSSAYFASGLFVVVLDRNRELVVEHLARVEKEQALRREAEEQLRVLVESSPAAVLTLDHRGVVLAANRAADALFGILEGQRLQGRVIASYLPLLSDALGLDQSGEGFRTAAAMLRPVRGTAKSSRPIRGFPPTGAAKERGWPRSWSIPPKRCAIAKSNTCAS